MSRIGEFTVPTDAFLLADTLESVPEMVVELQKVVAHSRGKLVPYFWVHHGNKAEFDTAIRRDSTLEGVVLLDEFERGTSYRGTWAENAEGIAYGYIEAGATILEATGQNDTWSLRMRFDDEESLQDFHEYCRREEIRSRSTSCITQHNRWRGDNLVSLRPSGRDSSMRFNAGSSTFLAR